MQYCIRSPASELMYKRSGENDLSTIQLNHIIYMPYFKIDRIVINFALSLGSLG